MNTRIQVEHPVTEMITGIDIVKEQIRIAEGYKLSFTQKDLKINGHAIECRIYAEDVDNNFIPSTGQIRYHRLPNGIGVRIDTGIDLLSDVSVYYDPLLSKVIAWGITRDAAITRMNRILSEYKIAGVLTNIPALKWTLKQPVFLDGLFDINFVDKYFMPLIPDKWKNELDNGYVDIASIVASLLKNQKSELNPSFIENEKTNRWKEKNDE
jgi:acetyl-CoA carboxylase biotin carboxylase subunit